MKCDKYIQTGYSVDIVKDGAISNVKEQKKGK